MNTHMPKAILFDLDDTILAFSDTAQPAWRAICTESAPKVDVSPDRLLNTIEDCRKWFWQDAERSKRGRFNLLQTRREIVGRAFRILQLDHSSLVDEIAGKYAALRLELLHPFPGALETLGSLKAQGIKLALLTNGEAEGQRRKVVRFGLVRLFDCILIEGELGTGKPDQGMYLHALERLLVSPAEAWMVGDNLEWDVAAPQQLGIVGVWVDFASRGLPDGSEVQPDRIIKSITELPK